ncbi:peptide ABC transporter substrate-binding protein [Cellulomonas chengniuliangii]|uniref:ABC transporter substrate-binding protein n=1 Tax=Cellulomonas chengniuliangii TaxID=2968084 RepID=A0ABY5L3R7_9CELL|nr:ABC transporter substrate-binding protein [Cellulomonas chengniuliangii]MCC2307051.1 ABC transporter substrate-binding protein [Cellulomonas chengniuliangii]MCC2316434.1 ABC transporter substrate-binding protein [Cellulomonas chengniuliangii]UUI76146.1 ABC transporter substrate-binding protein [Cellulomonas chengniuliangii]
MKIRRFAGFAATVAVGALALTSCSSSGSTGGEATTDGAGGIVTAWGSEPQNPLIPTNTNEVGGGKIIDLIFSGLVYYDADGAPHNEVAESIETDDAQTYTITLEEGWTFSNGEPVTSESFVDAWNYGAKLSNAQLSSYFFEMIEGFSWDEDSELTGLQIVDDTTFTVTLKQPEADFPLRLGYSAYFPLPQAAFEDMDAFGEHPIGNGPYKVASDDAWQHNVEIALVPNEDYTDERVPQNGGVTIKFYETVDGAYNDLLAGQLDVLDQVPDSAFSTVENELGDRAINQPAALNQTLTIPMDLEHFSGEEGVLRRQAISMAINREEITDAIFEGTRTPARDFTSPVIDGWSDDVAGVEVLEFNPEKARELWAEADAISPYTGTFTIGYNSDGGHQAWVDAVTNSLRNTLGISAEGNPYPAFKDLRADVTAGTISGAFRSGWQADYPSLYNFLGPIFGTGAGSNDAGYSSPEVDSLLAQGSAASSVDEANEYFTQVQEVLLQDLPQIPLWYQNVTGGSADTVSNVEFGWNGVPLLYEVTKG